MVKRVTCFVPYQNKAQVIETIKGLQEVNAAGKIFLLATDASAEKIEGCEILIIDSLKSTETVKLVS